MKVNFEIVYWNEEDNYFHSDELPAGYLYDAFAGITGVERENILQEYPQFSHCIFEFAINPKSKVRDMLEKLIEVIHLDRDGFYRCSSMVHFKIDNEIIHVMNYSVPISSITSIVYSDTSNPLARKN